VLEPISDKWGSWNERGMVVMRNVFYMYQVNTRLIRVLAALIVADGELSDRELSDRVYLIGSYLIGFI
jgi:hypothetical protein